MLRCFLLLAALAFSRFLDSDGRAPTPPLPLSADAYDPGVDSFVLLVDGSRTMGRSVLFRDFAWTEKLEVATALARDIVDQVPEESFESGVRVFGECNGETHTSLRAGMDRFQRDVAREAVDSIECAGGQDRLRTALDAVRDDLHGVDDSAVIVITDGKRTDTDEVVAATQLHRETGACLHVVQVGTDKQARRRLEKIVDAAGGCGSLINARDLEGETLLEFVAQALLVPTESSR